MDAYSGLGRVEHVSRSVQYFTNANLPTPLSCPIKALASQEVGASLFHVRIAFHCVEQAGIAP
jgi:hypothetical protein